MSDQQHERNPEAVIPVPKRFTGKTWTCEKHGKTNRVMSLLFGGEADRTYCLDCFVEKIGLPDIEGTRE